MSIKEMIRDHPDVGDDYNEQLGEAVRHLMYCAAICESCADACAAEPSVADLRQCIRACLDCADVCRAGTTVGLRRTGRNVETIRAMFDACIVACEACAAECEKHDHGHCGRCAEMCRECASDCRDALPTIQ